MCRSKGFLVINPIYGFPDIVSEKFCEVFGSCGVLPRHFFCVYYGKFSIVHRLFETIGQSGCFINRIRDPTISWPSWIPA